jgi:hypothetical protein
MRVLGLDLSTATGWSLFIDKEYVESGTITKITVPDFNVNNDPQNSPLYPFNILDASESLAETIFNLCESKNPDIIIIENLVKGRNPHTQRILDWIHFCVAKKLRTLNKPLKYMLPGEWRRAVNLKLDKEQKKNNQDVSKGKKRGKITKKHLSVNMVNSKFNLILKLKDNNEADAILLALGYIASN